jgi:hypothetical protein
MFETRFMFFPAQLCDVHESGRVLVLLRGRFCDFGLCVRGRIEGPVFEGLLELLWVGHVVPEVIEAAPPGLGIVVLPLVEDALDFFLAFERAASHRWLNP